jgi:hypothetical protein
MSTKKFSRRSRACFTIIRLTWVKLRVALRLRLARAHVQPAKEFFLRHILATWG